MKAIIALAFLFAIASAKLKVGDFQTQQVKNFKNSNDGKRIQSYLSDKGLVKGDFDVLYVAQQVVAGINYKMTLLDENRKIHLVKIFSPLVDGLELTRIASVDKGTATLIGQESIQKEAKEYIEAFFSDSMDGAVYNVASFIKFEHAVSEQKKDLVILAKVVLEGTDNSKSEVEVLLLKDNSGSFETYFIGQDKVDVQATGSGCGQYITAINCVLDKKCVANSIQGFSKCTPLGNLRYIA